MTARSLPDDLGDFLLRHLKFVLEPLVRVRCSIGLDLALHVFDQRHLEALVFGAERTTADVGETGALRGAPAGALRDDLKIPVFGGRHLKSAEELRAL